MKDNLDIQLQIAAGFRHAAQQFRIVEGIRGKDLWVNEIAATLRNALDLFLKVVNKIDVDNPTLEEIDQMQTIASTCAGLLTVMIERAGFMTRSAGPVERSKWSHIISESAKDKDTFNRFVHSAKLAKIDWVVAQSYDCGDLRCTNDHTDHAVEEIFPRDGEPLQGLEEGSDDETSLTFDITPGGQPLTADDVVKQYPHVPQEVAEAAARIVNRAGNDHLATTLMKAFALSGADMPEGD